MSTKLGKYVLVSIFTLILFSGPSLAQVAKVEPEQPRWGETLTVIYNPHAEGARLSPHDQVFVVGTLHFSDYSTGAVRARMKRVDTVFTYTVPIPKNLAYVAFHFFTWDGWDPHASIGTMIYRPDGRPAKGAYHKKMTAPFLARDYEQLFNKERELYPENFAVYRDKWFVASAFDRDRLTSIVAEDMAKLEHIKGEPLDWLYSLSYGYLLLKRERKSREIIKKMIRRYPTSPLTGRALQDYEYHVFAQQIKGEGPEEIKRLQWELIERHPDTELARHQIAFSGLAGEKDFPLAVVEAICEKWIADEPENPIPYFNLALSYYTHQQKIDRASSLIEKALNLLLRGRLRLYDDIAGKMTGRLIPSAYKLRAQIALEQRNDAQALAAIKAAQTLTAETDAEPYLIEGEIWQRLANASRAEAAYLEARRRGSAKAEDLLRAMYEEKHGDLTGFEDYLNEKRERSTTSTASMRRAPAFRATALDGQQFDSTVLRGKVAVLNFWFIGCAPCRVEIPGLNKLADEFKGEDVVFIAFALDDEKALRNFLKETTFKYHIVPRAGEIAEQFDISVFPTHIIIDKQGRIYAFLTGGNANRHEDLRPLIKHALKD